jgi:hypothetical protein
MKRGFFDSSTFQLCEPGRQKDKAPEKKLKILQFDAPRGVRFKYY